MDKDYQQVLAAYKFTDEHGHALENCADYIELLQELIFLRGMATRFEALAHRVEALERIQTERGDYEQEQNERGG